MVDKQTTNLNYFCNIYHIKIVEMNKLQKSYVLLFFFLNKKKNNISIYTPGHPLYMHIQYVSTYIEQFNTEVYKRSTCSA